MKWLNTWRDPDGSKYHPNRTALWLFTVVVVFLVTLGLGWIYLSNQTPKEKPAKPVPVSAEVLPYERELPWVRDFRIISDTTVEINGEIVEAHDGQKYTKHGEKLYISRDGK